MLYEAISDCRMWTKTMDYNENHYTYKLGARFFYKSHKKLALFQ